MKRTAMVIAVLGVCTFKLGLSNEKPAAQTPLAGQAAAPAGKRPPMAKTQPEFDTYKATVAMTDAPAQEKAANDFAVKFTDSELRPVIFKAVMYSYQKANNADKMMEAARKILTYDADDPEALLGVAQVLTERTRDTDLDKDERRAEARKNALRSLITVDTDVPTAGQTQEKLDAYKSFLRSEAYFVLGSLDFAKAAWADAEGNLRKSIDALPQDPDPVAIFRLSVALDMQSKYAEALRYANRAVELTKAGTNAGDAARNEQDRLMKATGGSVAAPKN
jgi:tetratricopeptide (TPR) repeat protein